jgi:hypothetical protein
VTGRAASGTKTCAALCWLVATGGPTLPVTQPQADPGREQLSAIGEETADRAHAVSDTYATALT